MQISQDFDLAIDLTHNIRVLEITFFPMIFLGMNQDALVDREGSKGAKLAVRTKGRDAKERW